MEQENRTVLSEMNVLMVDDSRSFLAGMVALLGPHVGKTDIFLNSKDALAFMVQSPPDIMVMALEMPEMSGLELVRRVKENPLLRDIPLLVLTGKEDSGVMVGAINAGADSCAVKSAVRECLLPQVLALGRLKGLYKNATRGRQLEAVQVLIGTYKHEFGNAIAAIDGKVRKLERTFPDLSQDDCVPALHKWILRMAETLKKLDGLRNYEEKSYIGSTQMVETE